MTFLKERIFNNPGRRYRDTYKLMYSGKTNALELEKTGEEDFQEYIESFEDGCDLNVIINKIKYGDLSQLEKTHGIYGDFSNMPQTLAETLQARLDCERLFDNLPDDVRNRFGSFGEFLSSAGEKQWFENLGVSFEEIKNEEPKKEEVKNEQE